MNEDHLKLLRDSQGKCVAIATRHGENLVVNVHWVSDEDRDVTYELITTDKGGFQQGALYALPLEDIISVIPFSQP
jgi:hypothetical protein